MTTSSTNGLHHLGFTVSDLEESAAFFTQVLGWDEVTRRDDYPAIFVSDGTILITLWQRKGDPHVAFDRFGNVGLHHAAFLVESEERLVELHQRIVDAGTKIEFAPEALGDGPMKHMMCFEPSGIRIEFIWPGTAQ